MLKPFNNPSIDQTASMLDQKLDMLTQEERPFQLQMLTRASCARADVAASPANRVVSNTARRAKANFFIPIRFLVCCAPQIIAADALTSNDSRV